MTQTQSLTAAQQFLVARQNLNGLVTDSDILDAVDQFGPDMSEWDSAVYEYVNDDQMPAGWQIATAERSALADDLTEWVEGDADDYPAITLAAWMAAQR